MIKPRGIREAIRKLERTAAGLRDIASGKALEKPANKMRAAGQTLLRTVFATSTEPSGAAMAPLKYRDGRPLVLTGALSRGARVTVVGVGPFGILIFFEVPDTGEVKAIWHQKGTLRGGPTTDPLRPQNRKTERAGLSESRHILARKMLPETMQEAAPWLAEMTRVGQAELDAQLGKLGF